MLRLAPDKASFIKKIALKNFKKYFSIKANPEAVYNALVNEMVIELWSNAEANFKEEPGTEFSIYDGDILGKNLEFEKNKKIVQEWYFGSPEGQESIVTIKIHADKLNTSLEINQTNIPEDAYENITEGWQHGIVDSLKEILEEV